MIGYLQGEVLEHSDGRVLIGVGDRKAFGAVGYVVAIPQTSDYGFFSIGQMIELFIHTQVREDALDLYGFKSVSEKNLFLMLLTVNGIGPKSALGILSAVEPASLLDSILQDDQDSLKKIPDIGKKTAERVVVELRDTVKKRIDQGAFDSLLKQSRNSLGAENARPASGSPAVSSLVKDAKAAVVGLGYKDHEAQQLLDKALQNKQYRPKGPEDLIRTVLRQLV